MSEAKVNVVVKTTAQVSYSPKIRVEFNDGYGSTSRALWDNPTTMEAFKLMFGVKPTEELASIEISEEGISATIRSLPKQVTQ
jgi:hypothetical protein